MVASGDEIRLVAKTVADTGDVSAIEAAFDGGVLRPVPGTVVAPASGDHWLAVASRDRAGNLSPIRWTLVRVDGEPPELEMRTSPAPVDDEAGRSWLPPGAEVVVSATDALAGVADVSLEVGGERRDAAGDRLAMPLPNDGEVRARGWGSDRVDNRSEPSVLDLWIDAAPPSVEIRIAGPHLEGAGGGLEGAVLTPSSRLEADLGDGGSGVAEWAPEIDGGTVSAGAWAGPWSSGRHTVGGIASDRVGNSARIGPVGFVVDGEGPEISWRVRSPGVANDEGEMYYWTPVEVTAEAQDRPAGLAELRVSLDGASYEILEGPLEVDGDRLHLRATDRLGNLTEVEASWGIDHDPPIVEVVPPGGAPVVAGGHLTVIQGDELEIRAIDRGSGIERAVHAYHIGWPLPGREPLPERILCSRRGRFFLNVHVVDRLGNELRGEWVIQVRRAPRDGGEEGR